MKELTQKQKQVLKYIYDVIKETNLPPTIREIAEHFRFSSTGTVRDYLRALANKGYIRVQAGKSRAIEIVREALFSVPILGRVHAGDPTLAVEDIEGYVDLDNLLFGESDVFALRVRGDSMVNAGIMPNDLVFVRKQSVAQVGETVVALIEDEATVKHLRRMGKKYFLVPDNPNYEAIPVDDKVSIIGKVITVLRQFS